jgi:hypothetical protein
MKWCIDVKGSKWCWIFQRRKRYEPFVIRFVHSKRPCSPLLRSKFFSWCAPSGFRVRCLPEPAPKELEARKAPSKIKLKDFLKRETYFCVDISRVKARFDGQCSPWTFHEAVYGYKPYYLTIWPTWGNKTCEKRGSNKREEPWMLTQAGWTNRRLSSQRSGHWPASNRGESIQVLKASLFYYTFYKHQKRERPAPLFVCVEANEGTQSSIQAFE